MTERSTNDDGLQWAEPTETAAPAPTPAVVETDPWAGWETWLRSHLDIERDLTVEVTGEVVARLRVEIAEAIEKKVEPLQRNIDIAPPTLAEIDRRIEERVAAKHQLMIDVSREVVAQLQSDAEMRGPPGPSGPRGEERRVSALKFRRQEAPRAFRRISESRGFDDDPMDVPSSAESRVKPSQC